MDAGVITEQKKIVKPLGQLISTPLDKTESGWPELTVTGIATDSRRVQPGDLFIAVTGLAADGHRFLAQAREAGAVAALVEHITDDPLPQIKIENTRRAMAEVAHRFYDHPAAKLKLFGITGTNGKTTIAAAIEAIARAGGLQIGVIGTAGHRVGDREIPAANTTPEAPTTDRLFIEMLENGITDCAMEVSSHAIKLERIQGLKFFGAVFTNLTRDHLDFHRDLDDYRETKFRLFTEHLTGGGFAIVNIDDPAGELLIDRLSGVTVWRYSLSDKKAELRFRLMDESLSGSVGVIFTPVGVHNIKTPLWGDFNFSNLTAAVGVALALGYPPEAIVGGIADFTGVPGRVQPLRGNFPFNVFIDFAHTPDALRRVLAAARPLVRGKMRVLFGCGGDRDQGKRPLMAEAVAEYADEIYLTSDNPRSEDPVKIIADVLEGFADPDRVIVEPDRAKAIERIINDCKPPDSAFLCGKGHETVQLIGEDAIEFDDRLVANRCLTRRGYSVDATGKFDRR